MQFSNKTPGVKTLGVFVCGWLGAVGYAGVYLCALTLLEVEILLQLCAGTASAESGGIMAPPA